MMFHVLLPFYFLTFVKDDKTFLSCYFVVVVVKVLFIFPTPSLKTKLWEECQLPNLTDSIPTQYRNSRSRIFCLSLLEEVIYHLRTKTLGVTFCSNFFLFK